MLLTELTIENYKSFYEATTMQFGPGFNLLLGANSSGKTTVLESIRFRDLENLPHRSIANIIEVDTPWRQPPQVTARFEMSLPQLQRMIVKDLAVVLETPKGIRIGTNDEIEEHWRDNPFSIEFSRKPRHPVEATFFPLGRRSASRQENVGMTSQQRAWMSSNGLSLPVGSTVVHRDSLEDIDELSQTLHNRIYRFSAERIVRASSGFSESELASDAANLAFCINYLNSHDALTFSDLNRYLHRIFPSIHGVSAIPGANSQFYLNVHTVASSERRGDLAVPIDRVGTGVTNAVAMLYVVLTARTPRIILLEEPNSYLHPRALRELLVILQEIGSIHQFFVTTHSSDVLRNIPASTVTLLEYDGIRTRARQTQASGLKEFTIGLLDLGIRLTDLHGCDRVLWVEGETEEAIFPKLLAHYFPEIAQGIATLRLHATGDFESRKLSAEKVAAIYRRLSQATFLAPPMVAITLDREGKQQSQIESIQKESQGVIQFLPRIMVEDYLLNSGAIVHVLKSEYQKEIDLSAVETCLANAKLNHNNSLFPRNPHNDTVHAAKVLKQVFEELGGEGATYDKAGHGPFLAEWILQNAPQDLEELHSWLSGFITSTQH